MAESCTAHLLHEPRFEYEPREAQSSVMYRITEEHLETFLEEAGSRSSGVSVPDFIEDELRKFLGCGLLQGGFARFKCENCGFERLVPLSCKCRSVCPSCSGRRMAERAAHLVDEVFPDVRVRQFVLTLPFQLRYRMAWDHKTTRAVLGVFSRAVMGFYRKRANKAGFSGGKTGGVTVIQRAGSGIKLNVHFHSAMLDGVFTETDFFGRLPCFAEDVCPASPSLRRIARRRFLKKGGNFFRV